MILRPDGGGEAGIPDAVEAGGTRRWPGMSTLRWFLLRRL